MRKLLLPLAVLTGFLAAAARAGPNIDNHLPGEPPPLGCYAYYWKA